jgi:hypothetical protein
LAVAKAGGNEAFFEADRDGEGAVFRVLISDIEDTEKFFLEVADFIDGGAGEANENDIGGLDGLGDFEFPILSREKTFFVEPRIEARFAEPPAEVSDTWLVLRGVAEKNAQRRHIRSFHS